MIQYSPMFHSELFPEDAGWFWHPERAPHESGYTLFRREFICRKEEELHLAISADNRYNLYLDGVFLGRGPVLGDLQHYSYEEYRRHVAPGRHILAVEVIVWQDGWRPAAAPWKEIHAGGGVMVCGYVGKSRLDMPDHWQCRIDAGRRPLEWSEAWENRIMTPIAPMDRVDFHHYRSSWAAEEAQESDWMKLRCLGSVCFQNRRGDAATPWALLPARIRPMQETMTPIRRIVSASAGISAVVKEGVVSASLPGGRSRLLIDLGQNQTSMIVIKGNGGEGTCRCAYAETLFSHGQKIREVTADAEIGRSGYADQLILPGAGNWEYHTFWFRTGRFIELDFDLAAPIGKLELRADLISYSFDRWIRFSSPGNPMLEKIWQTAILTARCCAHESYEDCPYYEQLQYAGDSRIQALVSYAATGDGTLGRQAIRHFDWSRDFSGLTRSRYPSAYFQTIPQFSLIWVMMVHDHYRYFGDISVILEHWQGIESVLNHFENLRDARSLIGCTQAWNFTDWAEGWPNGRSDRESDEPETIVNLFFVIAAKMASELARCAGMLPEAERWEKRSIQTKEAVKCYCWDKEKRCFQDVPGRAWYSLHANVLAILADALPREEQSGFSSEIIRDPELTQPTLYFRFYVLEALKKCGNAAGFIRMLEPWEKMIRLGFTTFPEVPSETTRSECHAWSAGPAYEFVTALMGIYPQRKGITSIDQKLAMPLEWKISGGFEPGFVPLKREKKHSIQEKEREIV